MPFKRKKKSNTTYENPESLFRDRRNRTVQGLLSHQSDILRHYHEKAFDSKNVALELPTGSGKTLVGLLIAEFRRVTRNERVLYLCSTRQLVSQVCEQSERKYGIKATPFIGSRGEYSQSDKHAYRTANTIAVATYNSLFNTNPFFTSPNLVILDDAHASENYIASNWSVVIDREKYAGIYNGLLSIIKDHLPLSQQERFLQNSINPLDLTLVEKIPTSQFISLIPQIHPYLEENTQGEPLWYPWSLIRDHLNACHLYIRTNQILIRPYIPPSMTHVPFAQANQRVFMSATLGLGGDLERITGVETFNRLPILDGWDKQGIGRRYFVFPKMSLQDEETDTLLKKMVQATGRALVLVPNNHMVEQYETLFDDYPTFSAKQIEVTKDAFLAKERAVAIFSNRYDGIDLPNKDCRLLIIDGLPKVTNLQEQFLVSKMASGHLLSDRVRTRIIQAFGRCTRSATDYAAVCIVSEDFYDWMTLSEKRSLFHPELQGEIIFGCETAENLSVDEFLDNLSIFLEHDKSWDEVDSDIREYRDEAKQMPIPGQVQMFDTAKLEVKYTYALWNSDYVKCVDLSQKIANLLTGDDSLRGLRGFWFYLAASAAIEAKKELGDDSYAAKAKLSYEMAHKCLPAVTWLRVLAQQKDTNTLDIEQENDACLNSNVESIERLFEARSYTSARRFEKDVKEILDGINQNESNLFEEAHKKLGELLGFTASNNSGNAAPDPWWISNDQLCIVSEDKSNANLDSTVSVKYARQAASHADWIQANVSLNTGASITTVMITPSQKIHKDVTTYAKDVMYWPINDFRGWAEHATSILRKLQLSFSGAGHVAWRDSVREKLLSEKLDPHSIVEMLSGRLLRDLPTE